MRAIRNKLNSRTGASITFALLLFLVCAVISSVVIVAATTAAGRMSQLPQMDQRYYAVTSAANLLKSEIDGKVVIVTEETTTSEGVTSKNYTAKYQGETGVHTPETIITDASKSFVRLLNNSDPSATSIARTFSLKANDETLTSLECSIEEKVQSNGMLVFDISNVGTTKYTLRIIFASNIRESAIKPETTLTWKFNNIRKMRNLNPVEEEGA